MSLINSLQTSDNTEGSFISVTKSHVAIKRFSGEREQGNSHSVLDLSRQVIGQSHVAQAICTALRRLHRQDQSEQISATGNVQSIIHTAPDGQNQAIRHLTSLLPKTEKFLLASTYIFDANSAAAKELFMAIAEKQRNTPEFKAYLAFNSLSSSSLTKIERLAEDCGAKICFGRFNANLLRNSLHSKLFVCDRTTAILGGNNINNPLEADTVAAVNGPIVDAMVKQWVKIWISCQTKTYTPGETFSSLVKTIKKAPAPAQAAEQVSMMAVEKPGSGLFDRHYKNDADVALLSAISHAEKSISLMSPNLNDAHLMKYLINAAKRGVHVKIVIPEGYGSLAAWIDRAGNDVAMFYRAQLPGAVRKNFEIRWYSEDGEHKSANHTKYYSIDGKFAWIGSMNGDNQSLSFSRELMLGVDDAQTAGVMDQKIFEQAWETSIPAKSRWWHKLLPIPGINFKDRVMKAITLPIELIDKFMPVSRALALRLVSFVF